MCPTIVLRDHRPVLALGGRGGRRIPNAVFMVLTEYLGRQASLQAAVAAPRLHTEGGMRLTFERGWPAAVPEYFRQVGYQVDQAASAVVDAVSRDPENGRLASAGR
jgi:gamma-glutamyltranspeptidase/glutathione hydrolase